MHDVGRLLHSVASTPVPVPGDGLSLTLHILLSTPRVKTPLPLSPPPLPGEGDQPYTQKYQFPSCPFHTNRAPDMPAPVPAARRRSRRRRRDRTLDAALNKSKTAARERNTRHIITTPNIIRPLPRDGRPPRKRVKGDLRSGRGLPKQTYFQPKTPQTMNPLNQQTNIGHKAPP